MPNSALNLKTGISPRNNDAFKSKGMFDQPKEYEKNYRYPDFGFEDNLNFGREENKQTIWQMLVDHVSGKNHNERIANIIKLYQDVKSQKVALNYNVKIKANKTKRKPPGSKSNGDRRRAGVVFDFNNQNERADFEMFMKDHAVTIMNQFKDKDLLKKQKDEKLVKRLGYVADPQIELNERIAQKERQKMN